MIEEVVEVSEKIVSDKEEVLSYFPERDKENLCKNIQVVENVIMDLSY